MNVAKYIRRENAPAPTIHDDDFISEFKNPAHYDVKSSNGLEMQHEIEGGHVFSFQRGDLEFADYKSAASHTAAVNSGVHPWDIYGDFGSPLDLPIDSNTLFNPKGLNDEQIHVARWQDEEGVENDFTQRQRNITSGIPLDAIKTNDTEYKTQLSNIKGELARQYDDGLFKYETYVNKQKAPAAEKQILIQGMKDRLIATKQFNMDAGVKKLDSIKERIFKKHTPEIVVEPVVKRAPNIEFIKHKTKAEIAAEKSQRAQAKADAFAAEKAKIPARTMRLPQTPPAPSKTTPRKSVFPDYNSDDYESGDKSNSEVDDSKGGYISEVLEFLKSDKFTPAKISDVQSAIFKQFKYKTTASTKEGLIKAYHKAIDKNARPMTLAGRLQAAGGGVGGPTPLKAPANKVKTK